MKIHWGGAARRFLHVVAFAAVIAVLTTLIWPRKGYPVQFAYAALVGTVCWVVIEFGRYLVPRAHCHRDGEQGHGWPKGWRGLLLIAFAMAAGSLVGEPLGDLLLGDGVVPSRRDNRISLAITVVAVVVASFYFHARGKAAELLALKNAAERDASEAKLKLLETQLEPHMLFNTLANLRALVTTDPARAERMLDHLIAYLRATLGGSRATLHPLADEFDRLRDYLEIMAIRMGPRLAYTLDLPDALRGVQVPPLVLQPLVENAIRHGLEPQVSGGRIGVAARRRDVRGVALLELQVCDDGAGLPVNAATLGTGFGLAQVRERLQTAYGSAAAIEIVASRAGGTCVTATFPINPVSS